MKLQVAVLGGGNSLEREVSLRSSKKVFDGARDAGFDAIFIDPAEDPGALAKLPKNTVVLPILHGAGGEDGAIQAELERLGLKFLGTGSKSSKLCFDKGESRKLFLKNDIPTAKAELVDAISYSKSALTKQPHVLKVLRGGSSIGTYIVKDPSHIDQTEVDEVFKLDREAVVEELVEGVEITVPVLGDKALPVIEIVPPGDGEFDYENKYNGKTQELCPPVSVDATTQIKAQKLAEIAHKAARCRHLSRTDMIVRPSGEIVVLEINTMPGMTDQSLYPKSAGVAGIGFPELIKQFINMAQAN